MPPNNQPLPTGAFGAWQVTALRDSITNELPQSGDGELKLFFYAITVSGWQEIAKSLTHWKQAGSSRSMYVYAGTDHALTDPDALRAAQKDGANVYLMEKYQGVFHPKVAWLSSKEIQKIWIGSNNLTKDGLLNNVEFAVLIQSEIVPEELQQWAKQVEAGSVPATEERLLSYQAERSAFQKKQAAAGAPTFTWSKKQEPANSAKAVEKGSLIIEVMPEETRGGNQVQLPRKAAKAFFGLKKKGDKASIQLKQAGSKEWRPLLISVFNNLTVRISINELEHGDRPCVIVLRKSSPNKVEFEIVSLSIFPSRYKKLLAMCTQQTRFGSRRWTIV